MSIQTLVLNNIEVLGYSHQNNFLGENAVNYSATKILSVRGYVLDLTNSVGVKDVFNDTTAIKSIAQNFHNIIINGQNFGIGKFTSLSFDEGNWVKTTRFNADIEVIVKVPITNINSKEFNNLNLENERFELIKNFTESFESNFDSNTKNFEGTHSIEIEYNADNRNLNTVALAQSLAADLLSNTLPSNLSELNYTVRANNSYKVLYNESYDLINGKCGFTKTFSYNTNNSNQPYSIERSISIEISEDGIGNSKEDCQVKAENNMPSLYANALIGLNEQITGSFNRCNEVFNIYKNKFNISGVLYRTEIQKNININKFDGIINYEIGYTTDKKFANQIYTVENTSTLDKNDNFIWTVSEQGTIIGLGGQNKISNNSSLKYFNAESGWNNTKTGIYSRSSGLWFLYAKEKASNNLNQISQRISRSPYQGQIAYTYTYTDDPTYRNDLGDIKKLNVEYRDNGNFGLSLNPIYKEFIIPNNKYTLVQNRYLKQQGSLSISATAEISLTGQNSIFDGYRYFTGSNAITGYVKDLAKGLFITGSEKDPYLESASYSSDEIEQTVTYEEVYKYS